MKEVFIEEGGENSTKLPQEKTATELKGGVASRASVSQLIPDKNQNLIRLIGTRSTVAPLPSRHARKNTRRRRPLASSLPDKPPSPTDILMEGERWVQESGERRCGDPSSDPLMDAAAAGGGCGPRSGCDLRRS